MAKKNREKLTCTLPASQLEYLRQRALSDDRTLGATVERLLDKGMKSEAEAIQNAQAQ